MSLLTEFVASPIFSTIAGGVGGIVSSVLGFFQTRQNNQFLLAKADKDMEMAKLMSNIEETKQAGLLAALREKGAGESFTGSINAAAQLHGGKRMDAFSAFVRPGMTCLYQTAFLLIFALSLIAWWNEWCDQAQIEPIIQYFVIAIINNANLCLCWWFGQRASDKAVIAWGNRVSGASVGPVRGSAAV